MITGQDIEAIEERVLLELRNRLNIRARRLSKGMKRAGRLLPREAHRAAGVVSDARRDVNNPKLARLIDPASLNAAEATILQHLGKIDPKERRKDAYLSMAGAQVLNLLGVGALVLGVLIWRDLL